MHTHCKTRFSTGALVVGIALAVGLCATALKPLIASAKGGETYSHAFKSATPQEVLRWMGSNGIVVQVNQGDLPEKRLSFAFDGIGKDDLVVQFGRLVGLQPEKRGDVYSLMKGVGGDSTSEYLGSEGVLGQRELIGQGLGREEVERLRQEERELHRMLREMQDPEHKGFTFGPDFMKGFEFELPEGFVHGFEFGPEFMKGFEFELPEGFAHGFEFGPEFMKGFEFDPEFQHGIMLSPDHEFIFMGPDFPQDVGSLVEEIMKTLEEAGAFSGQKMSDAKKAELKAKLKERLGKLHGLGKMHMIDPEHMTELNKLNQEEFRRAMEAQKKAMEELRQSGKLKEFNKAQLEELMKAQKAEQLKHREELHKLMEELRKSGKLGPEGKVVIPPIKMTDPKFNDEEFKKRMEEMRKHLEENMKVMQIKVENLKKFAASLTPAQKELAKKQGYLRPEDLTKEQRELIGIGADKGEVNMSFVIDGEKIVIKSGGAKSAPGSRITT